MQDKISTLTTISIHALREEGDPKKSTEADTGDVFLSTPSARRATAQHHGQVSGDAFLSTPSARRATPAHVRPRPDAGISIHALREEGDAWPASMRDGSSSISIHALREEGDQTLD